MTKFSMIMIAITIALFATLSLAAKVGKGYINGTFRGETADLQECYQIIISDGYGDDTCHSVFEGSVWSPSNPQNFGTSVSATMALSGTFCDIDALVNNAKSALAAACPLVELTITGYGATNTDASSAVTGSAAAVVAGVAAAAALAVVAF